MAATSASRPHRGRHRPSHRVERTLRDAVRGHEAEPALAHLLVRPRAPLRHLHEESLQLGEVAPPVGHVAVPHGAFGGGAGGVRMDVRSAGRRERRQPLAEGAHVPPRQPHAALRRGAGGAPLRVAHVVKLVRRGVQRLRRALRGIDVEEDRGVPVQVPDEAVLARLDHGIDAGAQHRSAREVGERPRGGGAHVHPPPLVHRAPQPGKPRAQLGRQHERLERGIDDRPAHGRVALLQPHVSFGAEEPPPVRRVGHLPRRGLAGDGEHRVGLVGYDGDADGRWILLRANRCRRHERQRQGERGDGSKTYGRHRANDPCR